VPWAQMQESKFLRSTGEEGASGGVFSVSSRRRAEGNNFRASSFLVSLWKQWKIGLAASGSPINSKFAASAEQRPSCAPERQRVRGSRRNIFDPVVRLVSAWGPETISVSK